MDRSLLDDPAAIAAMAAGNPAGLESVYRRYADRLYAYARSIVGDNDTAADVVQDVFLVAQERVRQLRDPGRLSSWLYAIARNESLARLRARKRTVTLAESHEPVLDTDPGRAVHAAQVRELVHAASAGMNDGDREVFELTVRHGLSAADVARVLAVSDKHAHARISRARSQFEGALGALVLARDGRGRCEQLDGIVRDWDGQLTALLRKRIERHARDCAVCAERRRERMNPAGLLAGYATLPFFAVAATLWPRLASAAGFSSATSAAGAVPAQGAPGGWGGGPGAPGGPTPADGGGLPVPGPGGGPTSGGPVPMMPGAPTGLAPGGPGAGPPTSMPPVGPTRLVPGGGGGRSKAGVVAAAAAAVLLIVAGVTAVRLLTLPRPVDTASFGGTADPSSQSPTASGSPSPSPPSSPPPAPSPPPPPPAFTVNASAELCNTPPNDLRVTATATVPLAQARIFYEQPPGVAAEDRAMTVSGSTAHLEFSDWSFAPEVRWWVVARSTDGRTRTTPQVTTFFGPC